MEQEQIPHLSLSNLFMRVFMWHIAFIIFLSFKTPQVSIQPQKKQFIAKTVELNPLKMATAPAKTPKTTPLKKVETPKPEVKENEMSKSMAKELKDRTLLKKASESLAKIKKTSDNNSKKQADSIKVPTDLKETPPVTIVKESGIGLYSDEVSSRLRLLLKLPEYGSVTVKLTLKRNGEVKQIDIVTALSELNADYVKKALAGIRFPGFGVAFEHSHEHTFEIILENEV